MSSLATPATASPVNTNSPLAQFICRYFPLLTPAQAEGLLKLFSHVGLWSNSIPNFETVGDLLNFLKANTQAKWFFSWSKYEEHKKAHPLSEIEETLLLPLLNTTGFLTPVAFQPPPNSNSAQPEHHLRHAAVILGTNAHLMAAALQQLSIDRKKPGFPNIEIIGVASTRPLDMPNMQALQEQPLAPAGVRDEAAMLQHLVRNEAKAWEGEVTPTTFVIDNNASATGAETTEKLKRVLDVRTQDTQPAATQLSKTIYVYISGPFIPRRFMEIQRILGPNYKCILVAPPFNDTDQPDRKTLFIHAALREVSAAIFDVVKVLTLEADTQPLSDAEKTQIQRLLHADPRKAPRAGNAPGAAALLATPGVRAVLAPPPRSAPAASSAAASSAPTSGSAAPPPTMGQ